MNYSPDYNLRRRNQNCGYSRCPSPRPPVRMPEPELPVKCPEKPLGMAYVPLQTWQDLYDPEYGFPIGTIFQQLDYPWEVGKCANRR